jgi:anthranilate/para-aminobenzoate synthase component II
MKDNNLQLLLLDNYDSFTYNLYDYLSILNTQCTVIRNDKITVELIKNRHFDGIVLSPGPKRPGKTSLMHHTQTSIFEGISTPTLVMRYHSLILENLPTCLVPIGHTPEKELMGLQHNSLPITGLQFHPESILTKSGFQMLSNWVKTVPKKI